MPVYEYRCEACGHEFERKQRITEAPNHTCVSCGAETAERKVSKPSFVLKGGGWFADGYGSRPSGGSREST